MLRYRMAIVMINQIKFSFIIFGILALSLGTLFTAPVALSGDNIWTIVVIRPFHDQEGNAHHLKQVSTYFSSQKKCEEFLVETLSAPNRKVTRKSKTNKTHVLEYRKSGKFASLFLEWQCLEIYRR